MNASTVGGGCPRTPGMLPFCSVILSIAKNLNTSIMCLQILHFIQNDRLYNSVIGVLTHPPTVEAF